MSGASPKPISNDNRIGELDLFRYLTVTLAIVSHIVIHHDIYSEADGGLGMVMKLVTRTATPSLLILMGMMIEIVHARRLRESGAKVFADLLYRALICGGIYIGFSALNKLLAFLNTASDTTGLVWATPGYAAILLSYAIILIIAPAWLWIRERFGFIPLIAISTSMVLGHTFFLVDLPLPAGATGTFASVVFGIGGDRGPSVIHALGLTTFGMLLANVVFAREKNRWAGTFLAASCLASAAVLTIAIVRWDFTSVVHYITDIHHWRHENHIGYYAFGILAALALLMLTKLIHPVLPHRLRRVTQSVGSATLVYFAIGSALLQAVPKFSVGSPVLGVAITGVYLLVFSVLTLVWSRLLKESGIYNTFKSNVRAVLQFMVLLSVPKERALDNSAQQQTA